MANLVFVRFEMVVRLPGGLEMFLCDSCSKYHGDYTDASLEGWGTICGDQEIFGPWDSDFKNPIDELELLNVLYAIHCWSEEWTLGSTIQLWCDNQVAVAYVKNMGGRVDRLDHIAKQIWQELECRDLFMIASYVNTKENPADALMRGISSKKQLLDCEVQLNPSVFSWVVEQGPFVPSVDWFASSVNAQLSRFYVWRYALAEGIDAFAFSWNLDYGYIFPPFILIPRILRKITEKRTRPKFFSYIQTGQECCGPRIFVG
jgi:hypothetical protein